MTEVSSSLTLLFACSGGTTAGLALAAHLSNLETKVCFSIHFLHLLMEINPDENMRVIEVLNENETIKDFACGYSGCHHTWTGMLSRLFRCL